MNNARPSRSWIWRTQFVVWLTLVVLLTVTGAVAFVPLGDGNLPLSIAIGMIKAIVIALFFMNLRKSNGLIVLASLSGFVFLFALFLLTFGDYLTRRHW